MNEQIDRALGELAEAWNRGDAAAYAAAFTPDADYITFFGARMQGRRAIEESHRMLFEGPLKGSRMGMDGERTIRMLTPDVALIVAAGGTSLDDGGEVPSDRESIVTFTAVRDGERWRFASFQNTRRTAPPGAPR
ncbi:SgcJ/EcaC family oxidoreductase [Glycomyces tenuis]|uniref:SgcJ/EcaC family oxidoreductase n=1 Tax=Glycomyces tenuis TaxID=58116 RepID=UPI000429354B|nr:SgcJ/EcaC family oxidoreductase [Glycomyces tenuis]